MTVREHAHLPASSLFVQDTAVDRALEDDLTMKVVERRLSVHSRAPQHLPSCLAGLKRWEVAGQNADCVEHLKRTKMVPRE